MWLRDWRVRRLSAIARDLPDDVRAKYEELRQVAPLRRDDEPAIRDLPSPDRQAPLTTDDLLTLPVADIIRHLREWTPTQGYFGPSYRSQGDALTRRENAIPIEHRSAVWSLLEVLSGDSSRSGVLGAEDRDPLLFALNSVRGSALQAIVTYLDWVQRQDPTPTRPAFELAPE